MNKNGKRMKRSGLPKKGIFADIGEHIAELLEDIKYSPLLDILFFKNNKIETPFAQDILNKFDLNLDQVTILHKPLHGTPAATIFNTILVDHHQMAKLTPDEQAFILGHEIVHLKNKDWLTLPVAIIASEVLMHIILYYATNAINLDDQDVSAAIHLCSWLPVELYCRIPLMMYLSRYQEKRCDIESAKTLKLAAAGASAFEKIRKKWICKQESTFNPSNIIRKILNAFGLYDSYPPLHDRSEYLLKLAKEQALELAL